MAEQKPRGGRTSAFAIAGLTLATGAGWAGHVGYDYTESTTFCASRCHTAMAPQAAAHGRSAHARVTCVQCHLPSGVGHRVGAKLASSSRVVTVAFNSYRGPIRSPPEHSSKVSARCANCHQLESGVPTKPMRVRYFRFDESNTPEQISLTLNLATNYAGGPRGAHWHANPEHRVTYASSDPLQQEIPWIHVRRMDGSETTYTWNRVSRSPSGEGQLIEHEMGCVDCHNRTGHESLAPETLVDQALLDGVLPTSLPWIKSHGVQALTGKLPPGNASEGILKLLVDNYQTRAPGVLLERNDAIHAASKVLGGIRERLAFPALSADHTSYPDNLGHRHSPGCLRCHDGQHFAPNGNALASDCGRTCHSEPQRSYQGNRAGNGPELGGEWHPWPSPAKVLDIPGHQLLCSDCHHAGGVPKRTCDDCHTP